MRIVLIGFGNVARGFLELLKLRHDTLKAGYGFEPVLTAIVTRRGSLVNPRGIDVRQDIALRPESIAVETAVADADVVVEVTPTDVRTGGIGLMHCRMALGMNKHVVTANKGPLVVAYRELAALAAARGVQFRFEGTVMGGTPSMLFGLEALRAAHIRSVRGIVNGTTNLILTQMESGESYADALRGAQQMGYAEADPAADVAGWDAAAKAVILANTLMGGDLRIGDVDRAGITGITPQLVADARAAGERWKLIARVSREENQVTASVGPTRVSLGDPLALVGGGMNALTYSTEAIGDVTLIGGGAGGRATGFAILNDLLSIHQRG